MPVEFTPQEEKRIGLYFHISILIKGAISLAEMVAGVALLFIPVSYFIDLLANWSQRFLHDRLGDFVTLHLTDIATQIAEISGIFIALYIFSRGFIKVGLIWAMLKNKLWAYPASLLVLGLFVAYQIYELVLTGSLPLIALTIFDLIVMYFIWREYQVLKFEQTSVTSAGEPL